MIVQCGSNNASSAPHHALEKAVPHQDPLSALFDFNIPAFLRTIRSYYIKSILDLFCSGNG